LLIVLFFIILLAWKPEALPVIARELGRLVREFRRSIDEAANSLSRGDPRDDLVIIARLLGISTDNKPREELLREIIGKLQPRNN